MKLVCMVVVAAVLASCGEALRLDGANQGALQVPVPEVVSCVETESPDVCPPFCFGSKKKRKQAVKKYKKPVGHMCEVRIGFSLSSTAGVGCDCPSGYVRNFDTKDCIIASKCGKKRFLAFGTLPQKELMPVDEGRGGDPTDDS